jgi:hypothetical protein
VEDSPLNLKEWDLDWHWHLQLFSSSAFKDYIMLHQHENTTCLVTCDHMVDYVSTQNSATKNITPFYLSSIVKKIHLVK